MKTNQLIYGLLLIISITACSTLENVIPFQTETVNQELIADGIDVYRENYCGSCHTLSIAETRGVFAPNHDTIVADAQAYITSANYSGEAQTIEAYIYESIVNPAVFYTPSYEASNHHMPAFQHLSEADLQAMVYMLVNQSFYVDADS